MAEPVSNPPLSRRSVFTTTMACSAIAAVYGWFTLDLSPMVNLFIEIAPAISVALWLNRDAAARHLKLPYESDFLFFTFWPLAVPWYAWRTRGRAGWRLTFELYFLALAPWLIAAFFAAARWTTDSAAPLP